MQAIGVSYARLMRISTERIDIALHGSDNTDRLLARQLRGNPLTWHRWQTEHGRLMRDVADAGARQAQSVALKNMAFRLIHRKALFEYLRDRTIRGRERTRIFAHFRRHQQYRDAVLAEHRVYLHKACSFLCTNHIGVDVLRDAGFEDPMLTYAQLYAEYFDLYCASLGGSDAQGPDAQAKKALLPLLQRQLTEWRAAILNPHTELPRLLRDAQLRLANGDTQRNPILGYDPGSWPERASGGAG